MDNKTAYVLKVAKSYQDKAEKYTRLAIDTDDKNAREIRLRAAYECQARASLLTEIAHDIEFL